MNVFLSELAESKLLKLNDYLLENWNLKVRNDFISLLTSKIEQISKHPESCPKSSDFKGLYKCMVTKQTTFYFKINVIENEIENITFFDTRQNPDNIKKDI